VSENKTENLLAKCRLYILSQRQSNTSIRWSDDPLQA